MSAKIKSQFPEINANKLRGRIVGLLELVLVMGERQKCERRSNEIHARGPNSYLVREPAEDAKLAVGLKSEDAKS